MNDCEQTIVAIIAVQFIGFLLILLWTRDDRKEN